MRCLSRFFRKPIPKEPIVRQSTPNTNVVALVVGHAPNNQGAINYLGESEFIFNSRIAKKVKKKLSENAIPSFSVQRGGDSYRDSCRLVAEACHENAARLSVHLHFNSYSRANVKGCEAYILATGSGLDDIFGDTFTDILNEKYSFVERGDDGLKYLEYGDRGYPMLEAVRNVGTIPVLVEPCFAHYRHVESALIFEQEDKYVDVLVEAITKVL